MNRRSFFKGVAASAVVAPAAMVKGHALSPIRWVPPMVSEEGEWPNSRVLAVKLPQPRDMPTENPYGINYWIYTPTVYPEFRHVGDGFYVGEWKGLKCRAILERKNGEFVCKNATIAGDIHPDQYPEMNKDEVAEKLQAIMRHHKFMPPASS